ncbi:lipoyl synthase [Solemya elarraichensis gill symbiont]|uniref:Lipoyl synthase n=1 Tax=Solemya elarraichensis gill symbiont TaxID=1918949 RepID=A0A1T2LCE8_9GAMM|nr:lipoyl synthase [Solemya elarraichensis gill symbiont]OOZ42777.1 lipoyl synthase [Solemya elarraichensis gill symbiont]
MDSKDLTPPSRKSSDTHQRGAEKVSRIPVKVEKSGELLRKPSWIRARAPSGKGTERIKEVLRKRKLSSVCEEALCPNLGECFSHGTATFMIMGDICTRRCPFCDVAHGKPLPLNADEPRQLAEAIREMQLNYVVITSVDRDDLRDGGAAHFTSCIEQTRLESPQTKIEVLVPDFRGRLEAALDSLCAAPPDVFNHNLETVPRLYKKARPGADYEWSLQLIKAYKKSQPDVLTKSGLMVGLGEELDEVREVMQALRDHDCDMLTIGQYLQPSRDHLAVERFVTPEEFEQLAEDARAMGFTNVASGPMVRSSYHADQQAISHLDKNG